MKHTVSKACIFLSLSFLCGCSSSVVDGSGMLNPAEKMLDHLCGDWSDTDHTWSIKVDGYNISIKKTDTEIYEGTYEMSFDNIEDISSKRELQLYQCDTVTSLYSENDMLFLTLNTEDNQQLQFEKEQ